MTNAYLLSAHWLLLPRGGTIGFRWETGQLVFICLLVCVCLTSVFLFAFLPLHHY